MSATIPAYAGDRRPRRLRAGDRVGLVAPAGAVPEKQLARGIEQLREWELEPVVGKHVLDRHPSLDYLAGTDEDRAADLQEAWCDPDLAAVLCVRGGYGSIRMLDLLDWDAMARAEPKILAGSSDITAVHQAVGYRLGVPTYFTPMLSNLAFTDDPPARERMRTLLFEPEQAVVLSGPSARPLVPGRARGITVGGNLSLIVSGTGVPDVPPPPPGAIALLEDVTEDPYRIDHFVTHLRRTGWFDRVGGIALGSWHDCGDLSTVEAVLTDRLADLGVPLLWELGFGHCDDQLSVPLGVEAELDADAGTLTLLESPLR